MTILAPVRSGSALVTHFKELRSQPSTHGEGNSISTAGEKGGAGVSYQHVTAGAA